MRPIFVMPVIDDSAAVHGFASGSTTPLTDYNNLYNDFQFKKNIIYYC